MEVKEIGEGVRGRRRESTRKKRQREDEENGKLFATFVHPLCNLLIMKDVKGPEASKDIHRKTPLLSVQERER